MRPECAGLMRNLPVEEPPLTPPRQQASAYFSDNDSPDKKLKKGIFTIQANNYCPANIIIDSLFIDFAGHVPFGYDEFGKTFEAMTNSALCNFTSNYRQRQSTEWAPVTITRPDPPLVMNPAELYHKHIGMLPNYAGHIPGLIFRYIGQYINFSLNVDKNFLLTFSL